MCLQLNAAQRICRVFPWNSEFSTVDLAHPDNRDSFRLADQLQQHLHGCDGIADNHGWRVFGLAVFGAREQTSDPVNLVLIARCEQLRSPSRYWVRSFVSFLAEGLMSCVGFGIQTFECLGNAGAPDALRVASVDEQTSLRCLLEHVASVIGELQLAGSMLWVGDLGRGSSEPVRGQVCVVKVPSRVRVRSCHLLSLGEGRRDWYVQ
jgi:hypothetical protein